MNQINFIVVSLKSETVLRIILVIQAHGDRPCYIELLLHLRIYKMKQSLCRHFDVRVSWLNYLTFTDKSVF